VRKTTSFSQYSRAPDLVLSPVDRATEVVFGLIMALTFTGGLSVATASQTEVRAMLIGALGCNLAWGMVDAVMFVLANMAERGRMESLGHPHVRLAVTMRDVRGAVAVFFLVFLSTIPVAVPFVLVDDTRHALRVSNGVAVLMLFACGFVLGDHAGGRKWAGGLLMLTVGGVLVWATIALGG
jgi:VIT1/CCC1 family predicted Fe2+/Mn2+ transporter